MTFSEVIRQALDERGWKAIQLAAEMSAKGDVVTVITVERWVNGTTEPTISRARLVAEILGLSLDDITLPQAIV